MTRAFAGSPLRRMARGQPAAAEAAPEERCDLCSEPLPGGHRHLVDLGTGEISCACQPCGVLFDQRAAGGGHYRLIRTRPRLLEDFRLDDLGWAALGIPVDLAFFVRSGESDRVTGYYPSPMGTMRSELELGTWQEVVEDNPVLGGLEPDVEALLANRVRGAREYWLLPLDECYRLVAVLRTRWQGFNGGDEVWEHVRRFFAELSPDAGRRAGPAGGEE
ncbi:hypothetical protein HUO13_23615 [Saccharopolyspora erythraea]|uniref:DUF5947 family protein n=1 Tax=Saccharopolyspora erythraea TaxID=1836 RepID=UPI001BA89C7B|nr:DUF5947 family protein [Saccharopolyspora erythraea]QUH03414.1 hypothetical protein HUO13_23615 [Saccharopolyspora erythraea]